MLPELIRHPVGNLGFCLLNREEGLRITEPFSHGLGPNACIFADGVNLTLIIKRDIATPITPCQHKALRQEGLLKGLSAIRYAPAILKYPFDIFRV